MRRTPVGAFSEKIWTLDRRLYHPRVHGAESEKEEAAISPGRDLYSGLL